MKYLKKFITIIADKQPTKVLMVGYGMLVLAGWLLLCLPFAQKAPVAAIDNLFMAVSNVSTTGLVLSSTAQQKTNGPP